MKMDKIINELKSVLERTITGVDKIGISDYRVNYGDSYMLFNYYEYTGMTKPIQQRILILKDCDVDDVVEELSSKVSMKSEYLGPIKNEINIHARGAVNDYVDWEKNNPPFMAEG